MTDKRRAEVFFKKVILEYVRGDLKWLLKRRTPTLGPLAACIGAGIDTAGGCTIGFRDGGRDNSRSRSIGFMQTYMNIDRTVAEVIYACVRCGYVHEGLSKLNVSWMADYQRFQQGVCVYRRDDDGVVVNLVEVAHAYLAAVRDLWRNRRTEIANFPVTEARDERTVAALGTALPDLCDLLNRCNDFLENTRGSHSMDDVFNGINFWSIDGYVRRHCR